MPNFTVRVEDRGRPVKGLRVQIKGYEVVTDENGRAHFRDVQPGSSLLTAGQDKWDGSGASLHVTADGPTDVTVPLQWPGITPVSVRSLMGAIHGPDFLPGQPHPKLSLDLLEARSGRKLKSLQANDRGEFDFENAAPGMYFINLNPSGLIGWSGEQIAGQIVADVSPSATALAIRLILDTASNVLYADIQMSAR